MVQPKYLKASMPRPHNIINREQSYFTSFCQQPKALGDGGNVAAGGGHITGRTSFEQVQRNRPLNNWARVTATRLRVVPGARGAEMVLVGTCAPTVPAPDARVPDGAPGAACPERRVAAKQAWEEGGLIPEDPGDWRPEPARLRVSEDGRVPAPPANPYEAGEGRTSRPRLLSAQRGDPTPHTQHLQTHSDGLPTPPRPLLGVLLWEGATGPQAPCETSSQRSPHCSR